MDNLKYYNDSFAYDYNIFAPAPKKKAEIHSYPTEETVVNSKAKAERAARNVLIRNIIISLLIIAAVCSTLFLRAEIASTKNDINAIKAEITELESENTRLSVEMERKMSVTNLEAAAIELGMQKCEKSQVTYIKTNEVDTVNMD